jgi:hypothetical protein
MPVKTVHLPYQFEEYHHVKENGIVIDTGSTQVTIQNGYTSTTEDVENWRDRMSRGVNATGEMSASGTSVDFAPMFAEVEYQKGGDPDSVRISTRAGVQSTGASIPLYNDLLGLARNRAKMRLYQKAISQQRKLQGGVLIGEIRELMAMLRNPARALRASLDAYHNSLRSKKGRVAKKDKQKVLTDTYLEYAFGWLPLLNDTRDAAEALAANYEKLKREVNTFTVSQTETQAEVLQPFIVTLGAHRWSVTKSYKRLDICKLLGSMASVAPSPMLRTTRELGFSPYDFVPTVYNLVPWSFVLDYFSNTGEVLDAWAARDIKFEWAQMTSITRNQGDRRCADLTEEWLVSQGHVPLASLFSPGKYKVDSWAISRERMGVTDLLPDFQWEIPGIRQNFNLLALASKFKKLTPW